MSNAEDTVKDNPAGISLGAHFAGVGTAAAAEKGAEAQVAASREALALLRGDLDPFRQLGVDQIEGAAALASDRDVQQALLAQDPNFQQLQSLSTDPNAQVSFLQDNVLFDSLRESASSDIFANQAARGKLGSTGTEEALQSSFLKIGSDLINQQIRRTQGAIAGREGIINEQLNRQLPLLNLGQASAAQVGAGSSELLTGIGNAEAAGGVGAANAQAAGASNIAGLAATAIPLIAASDSSLKTNIEITGNHNGLDVVKWDWNEKGNKLGLFGGGSGHIAQEVQKLHPDLVISNNGVLMVNYGTSDTVEPKTWQ